MLLLASLCSIIVPLRSEREADATFPGPCTGFSPLVPLFASRLHADSSDVQEAAGRKWKMAPA